MSLPLPPLPGDDRKRPHLRLALMLLVSAAVHGALLFAVQVGRIERPGAVPRGLQVRLAEVQRPAAPAPEAAPAPLPPTGDEPAPEVPREPSPAPPGPAQAQQDGPAAATPGMPEEAAGATTLDIPLPPDPNYYPARQVDEHPVLVSGGKPVYPEEAARRELRGEVIVLMLLNEHGAADEVSIVEARPPGMGFEEAVIAWLENARFRPAMRQGRAVKARVVYRVSFDP